MRIIKTVSMVLTWKLKNSENASEQMILKSASTAGRRTVNLQRGPFTYEIDLKYREQINITVDEKTGEPTINGK